MPRFAVVSRERHGRAKWLRFNGYAFAAADALAPSLKPTSSAADGTSDIEV